MRIIFGIFLLLIGCDGIAQPVKTAPLHSPAREFSGRGICGSSSPTDTEWRCGGQEVSAEFQDFRLEVDLVFQELVGVDTNLTVYLPDGYKLVFSFTKRCRTDLNPGVDLGCVPYTATIFAPPQVKLSPQEFLGIVVRKNYPEKITYVREGDVVRIELHDGRDHIKWPTLQNPSQRLKGQPVYQPLIQAHGIQAQIMGWKFTPLPTGAP